MAVTQERTDGGKDGALIISDNTVFTRSFDIQPPWTEIRFGAVISPANDTAPVLETTNGYIVSGATSPIGLSGSPFIFAVTDTSASSGMNALFGIVSTATSGTTLNNNPGYYTTASLSGCGVVAQTSAGSSYSPPLYYPIRNMYWLTNSMAEPVNYLGVRVVRSGDVVTVSMAHDSSQYFTFGWNTFPYTNLVNFLDTATYTNAVSTTASNWANINTFMVGWPFNVCKLRMHVTVLKKYS